MNQKLTLQKKQLQKAPKIILSVKIPTKWLVSLSEFDPFGQITFAKSQGAAPFNCFIHSSVGQGLNHKFLVCTLNGPHIMKATQKIQVILHPGRQIFWLHVELRSFIVSRFFLIGSKCDHKRETVPSVDVQGSFQGNKKVHSNWNIMWILYSFSTVFLILSH